MTRYVLTIEILPPARKLLKSMSIKQGRKYDSPESAADIRSFIQFHNLNVSEIREPIDSFSTSVLSSGLCHQQKKH